MVIMGWSSTSMAARYQHVTDPIRHAVAAQVGGLLWADGNPAEHANETTETTAVLGTDRPEEAAGHRAWSGWRRMRDSNPRGREPNPLSNSALAYS